MDETRSVGQIIPSEWITSKFITPKTEKKLLYFAYILGLLNQPSTTALHLIRECCPNETLIIWTKLDAYKEGCLEKIHKLHEESTNIIGMFIILCSIALVPPAVIVFKGLPLESSLTKPYKHSLSRGPLI